MADIQERIKKTGEYFGGMQVTKVDDTDVIYVIVHFPSRWIIDDAVQEKYDVSIVERSEGEYLFCAEMSVGFDAVFDAVDHCIQVNKDAMERAQLFQEKINELKEIFGNEENTIKKLRTLEFTFPRQKKEINKKRSPIEEVVEKELGNDGLETDTNDGRGE
jgi:hypothetical protein